MRHAGTGRPRRGAPKRLLAVVAALALALTACGGDANEQAEASDDDPAEQETTDEEPADEEPAEEEPAELTEVRMQLGWIASNNQLGEIVAAAKGFYAEEGIELTIDVGGPSIDGVALVASRQADIGQLSSSPSLMLAVSEGIPVKAFAAGAQEHPFTFFSMPETPLETPADMAGLHVGTQATAEILLNALLAANDMSRDDLANFTPVGADITPLLSGQVDVWTGWLTNTAQLDQLPEGHHRLRLWDAGVQLYALPYYAHVDFLEEHPDLVEGFLRATAKGWAYAEDNFDEAIDLLIEAYPNLDREAEVDGAKVILEFVLADTARADGWGTMDPEVWQNQLDLWDELGQFSADAPTLDEVVTFDFLEQTADARDVG